MTAQLQAIRPKLTMKKMSTIKPERKPISDDTFGLRRIDYLRQCYDSLYNFRKDMERATKYFNGDQWHELTEDRYGRVMTEGEYISSQGQIPIKQNVIKPTIRTLQGQFRSNTTSSVVVARTPEKGKESEMLSNTLQYNLVSVNNSKEIDSTTLEKFMLAGIGMQKISYKYLTELQRKDVLITDMNLYSMFFNGDIEDVRGFDLRVIGELMDFTLDELIMEFGKTKSREESLRQIYSGHNELIFSVPEALTSDSHYSKDFYVPNDISKCRVILAWEKKIVKQIEVHDWMEGVPFYMDHNKESLDYIKLVNEDRISKYVQAGELAEDTPIMTYEIETIQKWFYTYYSPWGHILQEGESPFTHGSHPYSIYIHKISDGKITGLVTDLIDTQRQFNRLHILNDRILASSVKNLLVVDKDSMDGQSKEDIIDDMKEPGGVIVLDMKKGAGQAPIEIKGSIGNLGIPEMIQMYMRTLQDVSGVHPAMQGQTAQSGTSGKLYQQQAQNSTLNSKDVMDAFASGQQRRDMKLLKTIQQFYDKPVMIAIAGKSYTETAQLYDPLKIKDVEFDLTIGQTSESPIYRSLIDDQLFQLLQGGLIDLELFLENTTTPFSSNLLESIRNRKRQLQENPQNPKAAINGLASDVAQQVPQANQQVVNAVSQDIRTQ